MPRAFAAVLGLGLTACQARLPAPGRVDFVAAADGDVAAWVAKTAADLRGRGRTVLVYEGASWCEPCKHFHEAANAGMLDAAFPSLTLLEFDADRDGGRLALAGYTTKLIPLFALPDDDGRASGKQIEGGVKGDGAVDEIAGRLAALLGR
jgi:hypothetical protein